MNSSLSFMLIVAQLAIAEFLNPAPAPWKATSVFHVGEVQTIRYKTSFESYTIGFWQQALAGGSARLGPILFQTTSGPQPSFDWIVQLYDFDLDISNIFFFWLFEGNDPSAQGNGTLPNMVSSYFNITKTPASGTSSSITLLPTSSTTTSNGWTTTAPSVQPTKSDQTRSKQSGGLSAGGSAGIGVGAAVGIIAIAGGITGILMARRRRARQAMQGQEYSPSYTVPQVKDPKITMQPVRSEMAATEPRAELG